MNWADGYQDYKNHFIIEKEDSIDYQLEIRGTVPNTSIENIIYSHIAGNTLPINLMYSGGIDSEFVIVMLQKLKVSFNIITMKLMYNKTILNSQDIYYSEKFCRHNSLKQKFVDLNCNRFYETGEYKTFIVPYKISSAYLASQFWLLSEIDGYNIIGGNYFWPHFEKPYPVLSPMSYGSNFHQKFIIDNRLKGIGNMLSHSYDINYILASEHKKYITKEQKIDAKVIKNKVYKTIAGRDLELRNISHGWEHREIFDITKYNLPNKTTHSKIIWDENLKALLETNCYENSVR